MNKTLIGAVTGLLMVAVCVAVMAEGTVTVATYKLGTVARYDIAWVASTNGTVADEDTETINGRIERVVIVPDTGATAPTDAYDLTLDDADDVDLLAGQGANLASNANQSVCGGEDLVSGSATGAIPFVVNGPVTVEITNAGSENGGTIRLYVRP